MTTFNCSHKIHRDIQRVFVLNGIKITFAFTQLDVYNVEILRLKNISTASVFKDTLCSEYEILRRETNNFLQDMMIKIDFLLDLLK